MLLPFSLIIVFIDPFFLSSLYYTFSTLFFPLYSLFSPSPAFSHTLSTLLFFITSYHVPSLHHPHPHSALLSTTSPLCYLLTPYRYCSLELIVSDDGQPLDLRHADMFSLGASVYELCLGRELGVL